MRTDYKDFIASTENRHYRQIDNDDGTISLVDETVYTQEGDKVSAGVLNELSQNAIWPLQYAKSGTVHQLTGLTTVSGVVSCVFTATADFVTGDTVTVDGTAYEIQLSNGSEPENNMFVSGAIISIIVDTEGKKVNFKSGGLVKALITELIETTKDWTNPTYNDRPVMVTVVGGGGGGTSASGGSVGYGGNGADIAFGTFELVKGEVVKVTVATAAAGNGAGSSFGSYLSASGGKRGQYVAGGNGAYKGGGGGGSNYNGNGEYGGQGGKPFDLSNYELDGSSGTNTVGMGLPFEGEGLAGKGGVTGASAGGDRGGRGGNGGSGGYGGNGGNGGDGGDKRYNDGSDGNPSYSSNGGYGGSAGGGGYGGNGGNGGGGGNGGTVGKYTNHPGQGGDGGHGGGGGYGAKGGNGGYGGDGLDILQIESKYPDAVITNDIVTGGNGGHGGGGGYGPDGNGGNGGYGGSPFWDGHREELIYGDGGNGGNGGYGAGGGGGGTAANLYGSEDGTGGKGGPGLVIIQYWGFA